MITTPGIVKSPLPTSHIVRGLDKVLLKGTVPVVTADYQNLCPGNERRLEIKGLRCMSEVSAASNSDTVDACKGESLVALTEVWEMLTMKYG